MWFSFSVLIKIVSRLLVVQAHANEYSVSSSQLILTAAINCARTNPGEPYSTHTVQLAALTALVIGYGWVFSPVSFLTVQQNLLMSEYTDVYFTFSSWKLWLLQFKTRKTSCLSKKYFLPFNSFLHKNIIKISFGKKKSAGHVVKEYWISLLALENMYNHNNLCYILCTNFSEIFHSEVNDTASLICLECKSSSQSRSPSNFRALVFIRSLDEGER